MGSTRPTAASRPASANAPARGVFARLAFAGAKVFWRYAVGGFRRRFRVSGERMIRQSVIFDVGRVLFDWDLRHLFAKLIDDRDQLEWFVTTVVTPQWHFRSGETRVGKECVRTCRDRRSPYP